MSLSRTRVGSLCWVLVSVRVVGQTQLPVFLKPQIFSTVLPGDMSRTVSIGYSETKVASSLFYSSEGSSIAGVLSARKGS